MFSRCIGSALLSLGLVVLTGQLYGGVDAKSKSHGHCVLNAIAQKLNLKDDQVQKIRTIHDRYDHKAEPLRKELTQLRQEQHQAMKDVLTEQQRAEVPSVLQAEVKKALQEVGSKLGLSDDQRQRAAQIAKEYEAKCQEAMKEKTPDHAKLHAIKVAGFEAFCGVLTDEQRVKLPGVLKEEMEVWHTTSSQGDLRNDIADRLQLTADQRKKIERVCSEHGPKIEKKKEELRQMWKDEHMEMSNVLTSEQRLKFLELINASAGEKK